MQRVFNKYGIAKTVVFKRITDEQHRLQVEQEYYDFFAKRGWVLTNPMPPMTSRQTDYTFAHQLEIRQKQGAAIHAFYATDEGKATRTQQMRTVWLDDEYRTKRLEQLRQSAKHLVETGWYSEHAKQMWQKPGHRDNMKAKQKAAWNRPDSRKRRLTAISNANKRPEVIAKRSAAMSAYANSAAGKEHLRKASAESRRRMIEKCAKYDNLYGAHVIYRYTVDNEVLASWMHFILVGDYAIAYAWDTHVFQKLVHRSDLPSGYVRAKGDTYADIVQLPTEVSTIIESFKLTKL